MENCWTEAVVLPRTITTPVFVWREVLLTPQLLGLNLIPERKISLAIQYYWI